MNYNPDGFIQPTEFEIVFSSALTNKAKETMIYVIYLGGVYNANRFPEERDPGASQAD